MIKHFDTLNHHKIASFAYRAMGECIEAGYAGDQIALHSSYGAIAYFYDGAPDECVGLIIYDYLKDENYIFVILGYVKPAFQRTGIYNELWEELIVKGRSLGTNKIKSLIASHNYVMRSIAERQGRAQTFIMYEFEIKEPPTNDQRLIENKSDHDCPF